MVGDECAKLGRDPAEIEITTAMPGMDLDAIKRLEDQGVSRLALGPPAFDRDGVRKGLESIANDIIPKV